MASAKQIAANRLNAQVSRGPRTDAGKQRAALNALRHGLSTPLESSEHAVHVSAIQALLQSEGEDTKLAWALARCIVDFERNTAHLRKQMALQCAGGTGQCGSEIDPAQNVAAVEPHTAQGLTPQRAARQAQPALDADGFMTDRYHRRAANQLIKMLRQLGP